MRVGGVVEGGGRGGGFLMRACGMCHLWGTFMKFCAGFKDILSKRFPDLPVYFAEFH